MKESLNVIYVSNFNSPEEQLEYQQIRERYLHFIHNAVHDTAVFLTESITIDGEPAGVGYYYDDNTLYDHVQVGVTETESIKKGIQLILSNDVESEQILKDMKEFQNKYHLSDHMSDQIQNMISNLEKVKTDGEETTTILNNVNHSLEEMEAEIAITAVPEEIIKDKPTDGTQKEATEPKSTPTITPKAPSSEDREALISKFIKSGNFSMNGEALLAYDAYSIDSSNVEVLDIGVDPMSLQLLYYYVGADVAAIKQSLAELDQKIHENDEKMKEIRSLLNSMQVDRFYMTKEDSDYYSKLQESYNSLKEENIALQQERDEYNEKLLKREPALEELKNYYEAFMQSEGSLENAFADIAASYLSHANASDEIWEALPCSDAEKAWMLLDLKNILEGFQGSSVVSLATGAENYMNQIIQDLTAAAYAVFGDVKGFVIDGSRIASDGWTTCSPDNIMFFFNQNGLLDPLGFCTGEHWEGNKIQDTGCSATSFASIVSTITGTPVTPDMIREIVQGLGVNDASTSSGKEYYEYINSEDNTLIPGYTAIWKSQLISDNKYEMIEEVLNVHGAVMATVREGDHWIATLGYNGSDPDHRQYIVNDPNPTNKNIIVDSASWQKSREKLYQENRYDTGGTTIFILPSECLEKVVINGNEYYQIINTG